MVSGGSRVPVGRAGLRQLTWHVHDVIRRAQDGGRLPGGWGYRGARVSYEVLVSRDAKDGSVVLNVRISGFEGLAAEPRGLAGGGGVDGARWHGGGAAGG